MNDLKIIISRSFARKKNLGNYQTADFFASYSSELLKDKLTAKQIQEESDYLFNLAKADVERGLDEYERGLALERIKNQDSERKRSIKEEAKLSEGIIEEN